jgi:mannonate dehydratase
MRLDHAPTMEGESNDTPGYTVRGQIFAVGYMKGLIDAIRQERSRMRT